MRAVADRSNRFVFDGVVDAYAAGRPDMPVDAVREGARAVGVPESGRVLEAGAGTGQLTAALVEAGFDVVALEPGGALRRRAAERVPSADLRPDTFESFEPGGRFDAVFSSNAFHWIDPGISYAKAADVADALVLLWDVPFLADGALFRRIQHDVLWPRGSTFPDEEGEVRAMLERDAAAARDELAASGRFDQPWWRVYARMLTYTPDRYVALIGSMSSIAASPDREDVLSELRELLGDEPLDVRDLVYVVAARAA